MKLNPNDIINGSFELVGAIINWLNVMRLWKDKQVKGVYYPVWIFFTLWGMWNIYYYPSLTQMWSLIGAIVMTISNLIWVILAIYFSRSSK